MNGPPPVVDLAHAPELRVGNLLIEPPHRRIAHGDTDTILEPKVMQVLVALARDPGVILSRDDLIASCWDGVVVGDDAINRVISQLRKRLNQVTGSAISIETITKVGYQLNVADSFAPSSGKELRAKLPWMLMFLCLALIAVVWFVQSETPQPGSEAREAIPAKIVLVPIETDRADDRYFAAGLRNGLSRWLKSTGRFQILGYRSSEAMAEQDISPGQIAKRLGAGDAWAIRLGHSDNGLAVTVSRFPAGAASASERFRIDGNLDNSGQLQGKIANLISERTASVPRARTGIKPVPILSGNDEQIYLTAVGLMETRELSRISAAVALLRPLLDRNPDSGPVMVQLAKAIAIENFLTKPRPENFQPTPEILALVERAKTVAPDLAEAYVVKSFIRGPMPEDRSDLEKAYALDPENPEIAENLGLLEFVELNLDRSWEIHYRAWQLDPFSPFYEDLGGTAASLGMHRRGREMDRRIAQYHPNPKSRERALARLALREKDMSRAIDHFIKAAPDTNSVETRYTESMLSIAFQFLGVPETFDGSPQQRSAYLALHGTLMPREEQQRIGVDTYDIFTLWRVLAALSVLYVEEGRSAELVRHYDRVFDSPVDFERTLQREYNNGPLKQLMVTPYLALALRDVGREAEARDLIARAEEQVRKVDRNRLRYDFVLALKARLAAVSGEKKQAVGLLSELKENGWPYNAPGWEIPGTMRLSEDPALDAIAGDAFVVAFDREIEEYRKRELSQTLAAHPELRGHRFGHP